MSTAKEQFLKHNTLTCIVELCVGHKTTVELRNEAYVSGRIIEVDGFMNVTMKKVIFTDPCGRKRSFDDFFVHSRLIRFVQIPSYIDLSTGLEDQVFKKKKAQKGRGNAPISKQRQSILAKKRKRQMEDSARAAAAALTTRSDLQKR